MGRVLLGRYALDSVIGAGGAARVFRATDRELDRPVAVKLLDDTIARTADPAARDRFMKEAVSAARVSHPHVVTVFDAGEDHGDLFLVMEFIDGRTLASLIAERAPLPADEALSITVQILDALATVHALGMIHRDLKPANVLVDVNGWVRLTDFGIAKQLDDIEAAVTTVGTLVGTPHYLAPEQAAGQPLTPATDVYQVGLVMFEMLTGTRAGGATAATAASARPVDPRRVRADVPGHVANVVVRATDRDPSARFDSALTMLHALTSQPASLPLASPASSLPAATDTAPHRTDRTRTMPIGLAAGSDRPAAQAAPPAAVQATSVIPATSVLTPNVRSRPSGPPVRRVAVWSAVAAVALVLIALVLSTRGDGAPALIDSIPSTTAPMVPVATTMPAAAASTAPAPADDEPVPADPGGNGRGKQNGKGNGKGGKDD